MGLCPCRCPSPQPGSHAAGGGQVCALQKLPVPGGCPALAPMAEPLGLADLVSPTEDPTAHPGQVPSQGASNLGTAG